MTRKRTPPAPRVVVTRYGDEGPWQVYLGPHSPFVADPSKAPSPTLADRYTATAVGTPPDLRVTITDRETEASVTIPAGIAEADAARLWRDARDIVGRARRQAGGPPVGSGLRPQQVIAMTVALWNPEPLPDGTAPTQDAVADKLLVTPRTISRVAATLPGPGEPWERLLRDARIARLDSVRLASSRSGPSASDDALRDGRTNNPSPMVAGHADPSADEPGRPTNTRSR